MKQGENNASTAVSLIFSAEQGEARAPAQGFVLRCLQERAEERLLAVLPTNVEHSLWFEQSSPELFGAA